MASLQERPFPVSVLHGEVKHRMRQKRNFFVGSFLIEQMQALFTLLSKFPLNL